ncbi:MAG: FkbM family methyltransferase [Bacteroidia bacterium]|nr:FkbM family methyltransferase [Bacteroidia bacterium]MDW8235016.1 FkbM family methyltransferase [Bacteroidia bacterium]
MQHTIRGLHWSDTLALWINAAFWLPRRWYWRWRLKEEHAAWQQLMRTPRYSWLHWPLSLKNRWYRWPEAGGIWVDATGLSWFLGNQHTHLPAHWLDRLKNSYIGFDIGAHRGYWTLAHAAHLPASCKVFLLEPEPENYLHLLRNLALNKAYYAIPLPFAAWRKPTFLQITPSKLSSEHASFGHQFQEAAQGQFQATSIDALVQALALSRVDWIKIDVEGAEVAVLEGACRTLETYYPSLWIEIHDSWDAVQAFLRGIGYTIRETLSTSAPSEGAFRETGYLWAEKLRK